MSDYLTMVGAYRAHYRNGLPYCSKFCFDRALQSTAQDVPLQENDHG